MSEQLRRVVVNDKYTYETDLELQVGDKVLLPVPEQKVPERGSTWEGEVTALESEYTGPCKRIVGKVEQ